MRPRACDRFSEIEDRKRNVCAMMKQNVIVRIRIMDVPEIFDENSI